MTKILSYFQNPLGNKKTINKAKQWQTNFLEENHI